MFVFLDYDNQKCIKVFMFLIIKTHRSIHVYNYKNCTLAICTRTQCFFPTNLGLEAGALSIGKNSDETGNLGKFVFNDYNEI